LHSFPRLFPERFFLEQFPFALAHGPYAVPKQEAAVPTDVTSIIFIFFIYIFIFINGNRHAPA
jgi:hypothetical protein